MRRWLCGLALVSACTPPVVLPDAGTTDASIADDAGHSFDAGMPLLRFTFDDVDDAGVRSSGELSHSLQLLTGQIIGEGVRGNSLGVDNATGNVGASLHADETLRLRVSDVVTTEAWIRQVSRHDSDVAISLGMLSIAISDEATSCTVIVDDGSAWTAAVPSTTRAIPTNDWTHFACAYDGETIALYIDTVLHPIAPGGTHANPRTVSPAGARLRADAWTMTLGAGAGFFGGIDEVLVWGVARRGVTICMDALGAQQADGSCVLP